MANVATTRDSQPASWWQQVCKYLDSKFWISLSLVLSTCLLIWSFTLPFRSNDELLNKTASHSVVDVTPVAASTPASVALADGREYRKAAIDLDRKFLATLHKDEVSAEDLPSIIESRRVWQQKVERAREEIENLGEVAPDSLEAQYRDKLLRWMEDAPQ